MTAKESTWKTIKVTLILCLVCSILVSSAAVLLRPLQVRNVQLDIERIILKLSGIAENSYALKDDKIIELYKQVTPKLVDLKTGEFIDTTPNGVTAELYNQRSASKDDKTSKKLTAKKDIANIKQQALVAKVYLIKHKDKLKTIILPIHGYGLWSTMYGFIALDSDLNTVRGLSFFSHGETPGLGGEVDNPKWKALWPGKEIYNKKGEVALHLVKQQSKDIKHEVDALSGASMTSNGVSNLIKFWMGPNGFKPLFERMHGGR